MPDQLEFDCPRCGAPTRTEHYGPCGSCIDALRVAFRREAVDVVVADYQPKMNVTPNAVALKDD